MRSTGKGVEADFTGKKKHGRIGRHRNKIIVLH